MIYKAPSKDIRFALNELAELPAICTLPGYEDCSVELTDAILEEGAKFCEQVLAPLNRSGDEEECRFDNGVVTFQQDLLENLKNGDKNYLALLDAADAYIARNGLDLPEEPEARRMLPDPQCVTQPLVELDLAQAGVTSIIWATGYAVDFSWLQVDAFDAKGKPQHQRGVSSEPGVYFLGLPWLSRRGSSFIWGVWHDAKHVAGHIATQRTYLAYRDSAARQHAD